MYPLPPSITFQVRDVSHERMAPAVEVEGTIKMTISRVTFSDKPVAVNLAREKKAIADAIHDALVTDLQLILVRVDAMIDREVHGMIGFDSCCRLSERLRQQLAESFAEFLRPPSQAEVDAMPVTIVG